MRLDDLLALQPGIVAIFGDTAVEIESIVSDSRQVTPGALFVAYSGVGADGHRFIPAALERGAVAVAGSQPPPAGCHVPYVRVTDGRAALAWFAAAWHGRPSDAMALVGVTGTDGKTTTASLLHSILLAAGRRAGMISTVSAVVGDTEYDTGLHTTTPDAPDVQRLLAAMRDAGVEVTVLETTSHGLAQHRVTGNAFDVAVVTNITHEHLDFHGSYAAYRDAKAMLFRTLSTEPVVRKPGWPSLRKTAVLNRDDDSFDFLRLIPAEQILTYGIESASNRPEGDGDLSLTATNVLHRPSGVEFDCVIRAPGDASRELHISSVLVGRFNISNILAATGAALALGVDDNDISLGVARLAGVIGRMERIDRGQAFTAIVDFAHTPNALAEALKTARQLTVQGGRVIAVFGSAGLRDREKRRMMGVEAARWADFTVITAEDPRTESLDAILAATAEAMQSEGKVEGWDFTRITDRQAAILYAVRAALPGDVVIVCGKGHEQSMCFETVEHPWRDQDAMRWALGRLAGGTDEPPFRLPTWQTQ